MLTPTHAAARSGRRDILINAAAYQLGWFACVLGAVNGAPWLGPLCLVPVVGLFLRMRPDPGPALALLGVVGMLGLAWDSLLVSLGWLAYPSGTWIEGLAPYWMLALWVMFATTLDLSFGWLRGRALLAAALGAVFGPMAYLAGQRVGAVEFLAPMHASLALAAGWAVFMPGLVWLSAQLEMAGRMTVVESAHV